MRACEKYGRKQVALIASEVDGKNEEEVRGRSLLCYTRPLLCYTCGSRGRLAAQSPHASAAPETPR